MRAEYEFEFLIKMYEECQSQRRHHETYRAKLTEILIYCHTPITHLNPVANLLINKGLH